MIGCAGYPTKWCWARRRQPGHDGLQIAVDNAGILPSRYRALVRQSAGLRLHDDGGRVQSGNRF